MKKKLSFIALAFAMIAISALLFSGCDWLFGNNDNSACAHTWKWVITTPPPVTSGGDEDEDGEEDEGYSIATQHCTKCNATGRTINVPEGTDISDLDNFFVTGGNDNGNVNIPSIPAIPDAEWLRIIDRVNLLVDNHFENRDYSEGEKANWNIAGLSVGVYKNGRTAFFNRGYHESEQRNIARRRPITENSIFMIGSLSKPVSNILFSYFSRNNPTTGSPIVNLNDPLNKYFKTKPYIDTNKTQVHPTLLQFATHYAGVPRYVGADTKSTFGTFESFKSTLENLTYLYKPGTTYNYSMGAAVVANVIASLYYNDFPQRRTGDLLTERLFNPLGMNSSMLHGWVNPAMHDRLALPHNFSGTAKSLNLSEDKSVTLIGASGEITSTTSDMMRLAAFIIGDNVPAGAGVLQQAAAAGIGWGSGNRSVPSTAFTPYESNASELGGWFGELFGRPSNSGRYGKNLSHGGTVSGYQSYMIICPDTKTAVVVMVNNMSSRGSLAQQIMDRALNATYPINTGIASYTEARVKEDIPRPKTPFNDFDALVESYSRANANVDIVLNEDLTIELPMNNIRTPATAGITLTIRSANPSQPVTLTRGVSGNLFTVSYGATLIFRDIIIDGGKNGAFAESGGGTLVRVNSGTFIMNSGAILCNNANSGSTSAVNGGGVVLDGSTATFTMSGGEITGNTSGFEAGGVYVNSGSTFTMSGGKINGNTANNNPGGVYVRDSTFTMSGGEISGNTSSTMSGVRVLRSTFTLTGGVVAGNGSALTNVVNGTYNLNTSTGSAPNNAIVIAWNRPTGTLNYTDGSRTNLTVSPGGTAVWEDRDGVLGISYANGTNTGWIKAW